VACFDWELCVVSTVHVSWVRVPNKIVGATAFLATFVAHFQTVKDSWIGVTGSTLLNAAINISWLLLLSLVSCRRLLC